MFDNAIKALTRFLSLIKKPSTEYAVIVYEEYQGNDEWDAGYLMAYKDGKLTGTPENIY